MGGAQQRRPKSIWLAYALRFHRSALAFDFQALLQIPLRLVNTPDLSWSEAWDYFVEITKHDGSHVVAAFTKRGYVPHPASEAAWEIAIAKANGAKRNAAKNRKRPWDDPIVPLDITAAMSSERAITEESAARRRALDERFGALPQ